MRFDAAPVALRDWVIEDASGGRTEIILSDVETGLDLPNSLFNAAGELGLRDR